MTYFAPSELDFINCKRCFFINKVKGFKLPPNIPGVFSTFDRSQKKYFISKDTDILYCCLSFFDQSEEFAKVLISYNITLICFG